MLPSRWHDALEELIQPQPANDFQSQPRAAELAAVLHANARGVDFDPQRLHRFLVVLLTEQRQLLLAARRCRFFRVRRTRVSNRLLHSQPPRFVKLPQPGDNALPRPSVGAIRFDERPIRMPLAVLVAKTLSKKHTRKCYRPIRSGPEQRSSLQRVQTCRCQNSFFRHRRKTTYVDLPPKIFRKKPFWSVTGELGLDVLNLS